MQITQNVLINKDFPLEIMKFIKSILYLRF